VREALPISERRACLVLDCARSSHRYASRRPPREARLLARLVALHLLHPRYGYRRMTVMLRRAGWTVNRKAVQRLWALAGLQVPRKRCKRRHGSAAHSHLVASRPGEIWCLDFMQDRTADGRSVRLLGVLDEFTREGLAFVPDRRMTAEDVIDVLEGLVFRQGAPAYLRCDNGPEFIADAIRAWLAAAGIATLYIEPGCPWQNGTMESWNGKTRDEFLDRELLGSVEETAWLATRHLWQYNHERPHSSLGDLAPLEFKAKWLAEHGGVAAGGMTEAHA
jgi:transposase InsO family protein